MTDQSLSVLLSIMYIVNKVNQSKLFSSVISKYSHSNLFVFKILQH